MPTDPEIFKRFPQLRSQIPWVALGDWPTPCGRLRGLERRLGAEIWIKRDDLSSAHHGGNKVRKLEFLLGEALELRAEHIVTSGMLGSPQLSVVGYHAGRLGLHAHVALLRQPLSREVLGRLELARQFGVDLWPCINRRHLKLVAMWQLRRYRRAYYIPPGGTSPCGILGHVSAMLELKAQIDQGMLPTPEVIIVALGSGGSLAGLSLGAALAGLNQVQVMGVKVVDRPLERTFVQRLIDQTSGRLAQAGIASRGHAPIEITAEHLGRGYGYPTTEGLRVTRVCAEEEGIQLDPTYTGKAMAHLFQRAAAPGGVRRYLFWQTYDGRDLPVTFNGPRDELPRRVRRWIKKSSLA